MKLPLAIDRERWSKMNIFDQMGNISSEVGRSFNARRKNNEIDCMLAVARAVDLFDVTTEVLIAQKSPRAKEVLRAKETYLLAIFDRSNQSSDFDSLQRYFMQYAVAARLNK